MLCCVRTRRGNPPQTQYSVGNVADSLATTGILTPSQAHATPGPSDANVRGCPAGERMRVIAGSARGRRLRSPRGRVTRPTADRVREALFDLLGGRCSGARVLDLFAGTGALGIEALSRGAASSVFVERATGPLTALRLNIEACGFGERAEVRRGDALRVLTGLAQGERRFDLVFLDPPYGEGLVRRALGALTRSELLADGACLAVEMAAAGDDPGEDAEALSLEKTRRYGETTIRLYRAVGRSESC